MCLEPHRLVFVDETGTTTKMTRLRGRARRGERVKASAPFGHWATQTFIAALRYDGLTAPWIVDRPMNKSIFETWVETQLAPTLQPGDVVILDNLSSHKSEKAKAILQGKFVRQADAAVRRRVAGQVAAVERDAAPGEPLHVGHRGIVIEARIMLDVALQDGEHAGRRPVAGTAGRDGRNADRHAIAVYHGALGGEAHDEQGGAFGRHVGRPEKLARLKPFRRSHHGARFKRGLSRQARLGQRRREQNKNFRR